MRIIWIKEVVGCTCDTVYLGKSTDTEKADADTKERKKLCILIMLCYNNMDRRVYT